MQIKLRSTKEKLGIITVLYLIFNILFSKAGIKINDIPITIGNIIFLLMVMVSIPIFIKRKYKIDSNIVFLILSIVYWAFRLIFFHRYTDNGMLISYIACLCGYPLIYFVFQVFVDSKIKLQKVLKIISILTIVIMFYTIIQYIFGIAETAIPGLTVNYSDYAEHPQNWWTYKHNSYSDSSKFVSTFQNGNLFGVNLLLLFPIAYYNLKDNYVKYFIIFLFLFNCLLSGSRTVYITLIVFCILNLFDMKKAKKIKISSVLLFMFGIIIIVISLGIMNKTLIARLSTIWDLQFISNASGRIPSLLKYLQWIDNKGGIVSVIFGGLGCNYYGGAYEITIICIFVIGGIVGVAFSMLSIVPIYMKIIRNKNDEIIKGLNYSITLYFIASISDGGYWLTPTALNFWMVLAIANQSFKYHSVQNDS